MNDIKEIVSIARKLQDHSVQHSRLEWVHFTAGYDLGIQEAYQKLVDVYTDAGNYQAILDTLEKDLSSVDRRRVEILERSFRPYHQSKEANEVDLKIQELSNKLSHILNTHRSVINGREMTLTEIYRITREDPDRDNRKVATMSLTQVNQALADNGFVELVKLRNEYARLNGADNFVAYSLEKQELDPHLFDSWPEEIKAFQPEIKKLDQHYAEMYLNDSMILPWDGSYIAAQLAPSLSQKVDMSEFVKPLLNLYKKFGFDFTQYNLTFDIFPRKNKSEWGYLFNVEPGLDARILANVTNRYMEYEILLHEIGHAVHYFNTDPEEILLNMGISGIISEGIAVLFQDFYYRKVFYSQFFDNSGIDEEMSKLKQWAKSSKIGSVLSILFDQALYLNPIENLDDIHHLHWDLRKKLFDKEPYAEVPLWGNTIHYTTHPIYLHNYFMGDLTSLMLQKVFCDQLDVQTIEDKPEEFGRFLVDKVIKPSGEFTYLDMYKKISGESFSLKYLSLD